MVAMSRRIRSLTAVLASAMLLFAQLAVSAYACPAVAAAHEPVAMAADCDQDMGNANLCESHCDYGSASFEAAKPLQVPAVAMSSGLRIELPDSCAASTVARPPRVAAGPAPPPPLARFTVLRI